MAEMNEVVGTWDEYLRTVKNWEELIEGVTPKETGCGLVYELPNPIERPNESFAIADMRRLELSEPHKHINGETEIYFVLQGVGRIAVGEKVSDLAPGTVVVTPPDTPHITLPQKDLVLAVVNTPPFDANNYVVVPQDDRSIAKTIASLKR